MPKFEKESFFKSFLLFFIVIELFLGFIFYNYSVIDKEHLRENLFLEMKNYSYFFDNDKFKIDFEIKKDCILYELQEDEKNLFICVNIFDNSKDILKIIYPRDKFVAELKQINLDLFMQFLLFSFISFFISLIFSFYSLYPLQTSYKLLQEFMKDILHDINTPISAIKLNLELIDEKSEEVESIKSSINTLEMLHKNLENYLGTTSIQLKDENIKDILDEQIYFFKNLYDKLEWIEDISSDIIKTDRYLLSRVIYNLLDNSCKYNIKNGFVKIEYKDGLLVISNSSFGIKNIKKLTNRFYKESDRGLGIGLHIVSKILKQLRYNYKIDIDKDNIVYMKIKML